MSNYPQTHPWITFSIDLTRAGPRLWTMLGEARSKIEHLAGVPLRPATAQAMTQISLIRGAVATAAIEGNTLSEEEARRFLDDESSLPKSKRYMGAEIRNVVEECNAIWERCCTSDEEEITIERILGYNKRLLFETIYAPEVVPGEFRTHSVGVNRYRAPEAAEVPELMQHFVEWFGGNDFRQARGAVDDPGMLAILGAILAHLYFAWIHPFGDGNGRTARLIEFAMLLRADVPTVAAHLLSNHYNETRTNYYQQLDRASGTRDPLPFIEYALQGLVDGLREQIRKVRDEQVDVAWTNYVYEKFRPATGAVMRRRRELVLALSTQEHPVARDRVPLLSTELANDYRSLTPKAIARDLNHLVEMGLIEELGRGQWRARKSDIEAFIPPRRTRVVAARKRIPGLDLGSVSTEA